MSDERTCSYCGEPIDGPYVTTGLLHYLGPTIRHKACASKQDGPSWSYGTWTVSRELLRDYGHPVPPDPPKEKFPDWDNL